MGQASFLSPIGQILLRAEAGSLNSIEIVADGTRQEQSPDSVLIEAVAQLRAWFGGTLDQFDLPLARPKARRIARRSHRYRSERRSAMARSPA